MRALALVLATIAGCAGSRVATIDGGPPIAEGDVDVIGSWHDCISSVTYEPDGRVVFVDQRRACRGEGTWDVDGSTLTITWDASMTTCESSSGSIVREVIRAGRGLISVDPATGRTSRYADDATPRGRWRLDGSETGGMPASSIVRVVGETGDPYASGCYWSADGACGGIFSCTGSIVDWSIADDGTFRGSSQCGGECPCSATFSGTLEEDGTLDATYRGANCDRPISGTFTAIPEPDPL